MNRHDRRRLGDEELAQLARAGDSKAFGELWERHSKQGLTAARHFRSIADPDDIVAEAYLQILRAIQRGGGPNEAFRPYLYRTIRNVALGWVPKSGSVPLEHAAELEDERIDIENTTLENTITVRAFRTLPERWQTVLWYTEVEGMDPAEAAPYLGLTANGTAALAYRARDALKKAWLQAHVSDLRVPPECRWTTERMGEYARGGLTPRARKRFDDHLESCVRCSILLEELDQLGGRLAAILLPTVLGGAVGAEFLAAHLASQHHGPAVRTDATGARNLVIGSAAAVVLAAGITAATFAANGAFTPSEPTAERSPLPIAEEPSTPRETPTPTPPPATPPPAPPPATPTPPPAPPRVAPPAPTPPPPPADTTAPGAPVVTAPANGLLTADAQPLFSGTGEPGAQVEVRRLAADGVIALERVAIATVAANGSWSAEATVAIPDGPAALSISQVDAAGNRSTTTGRTLTIDTIAVAPAVDALDPMPLMFLPDITGQAEAGAEVELFDENGLPLGSAIADAAGVWVIPLPDPLRDDESITAVQTDPAGNRSDASAALGPLVFERPEILTPASPTVPSTGGSTVVSVTLAGIAGAQVQIAIDGTPTGNIHTLQAQPIVRVTPPLPDGEHTIEVRYYDTATGRRGSVTAITFTIG